MSPRRPSPVLALALTLAASAAAAAAPATSAPRTLPAPLPAHAASAERPRNVVLMIPDGCGPAMLALARLVADRPLTLDSLLTGMVETRAADARVTDSAAGATAYAAGVRTYNGGISQDVDHRPLGTVLEAAEAAGLATGLVATSRITHATPAAFAAHVDQRASEDDIAAQMMAQDIEVLLGGGRTRFLPRAAGGTRRDGRDLLAEARARGVRIVTDAEGLAAARRSPGAPLVGLFAADHLEFALDGDSTAQPRLVEMTRVALERLARAPRGFFLMVEGSRIDHAAHESDAAAAVREALEYDEAVREALAFARRDGRTLVVSVADHETGGLTLGRLIGSDSRTDLDPDALRRPRASAARVADRLRAGAPPAVTLREWAGLDGLDEDERRLIADALAARGRLDWAVAEVVDRRARVAFTTHGHTAADVSLHAWGPGRERFVGLLGNDQVGRRVAEALGLDLDAVTRRLRAAR